MISHTQLVGAGISLSGFVVGYVMGWRASNRVRRAARR